MSSLIPMLKAYFPRKAKGSKELIVEIALIIMVVALVVVFRGQISTLITNFMGGATNKINTMLA